MKISALSTAFVLLTAFTVNSAKALTDQQALEDGMTPMEQMSPSEMSADDLKAVMNYERSEYVSTIPSQEDIENVVKSHRQVIVVNKGNKSANNPLGQTLRVFQNGSILPLSYTTLNSRETFTKDAVDISTGREKEEVAESGRSYFSSTPKGFFRPQRIYENYYSITWAADMPNAVFMCQNFARECGIAIHATSKSHYAELGTKASGGCVRTRLDISQQIRKLVMDSGLGSEAGKFTVKPDGTHPKRRKVFNNSVSVDQISLNSGDILNKKVNSWDTVIVVYE
jgi:lipoprotein-anchoring transpeptidase ErfK/SrfK